MRKAASALLVLAVIAGCGDDGAEGAPSSATPPSSAPATWTETLPEGDCAAGTRPSVGLTACVPVGVPSCPAGFAPDPSGWGCREILPTAKCEGATREALGATTCLPVGDCDAAFPPAGATLFVDPNATPDATHFKTIGAAVAAATAGSIIAVDRGTYVENVAVRSSITIHGRCARDVLVTSPDGLGPGIEAGAKGVTVRGLTLRGHRGGVATILKGTATVEDVVVDHARLVGLMVSTGSMTVTRSRVVDTQELGGSGGAAVIVQHGAISVSDSALVGGFGAAASAGIDGEKDDSKIHLERSVIRGVAPATSGNGGAGVTVGYNGSVEVVQSAIIDTHATGVEILDGASGTVTGCVVRGTAPNGKGLHGDALTVGSGATATVAQSTFADASEFTVFGVGAGTKLVMNDSVARGEGRGVVVMQGASATLGSVAVVGTTELGLLAQEPQSVLHVERSLVRAISPARDTPNVGEGAAATYGGVLELVDTAIVQPHQVGIAVGGLGTPSRASLDHVAILAPRLAPSGAGRGVESSAGSEVAIVDSIVDGAPEAGVVAGDLSRVTMLRTVVRRTRAQTGALFQHGLVCVDGATLDVQTSLVDANAGAGIAYSNASGRLDDVLVRGNGIGLAARNATVTEVETLPDADAEGTLYVRATRFEGNATRFSGDAIPLPSVRGF